MRGRKRPGEASALPVLRGFFMARADFIVQTKPSMWGECVQIRAGWGLGAWLLPRGLANGPELQEMF